MCLCLKNAKLCSSEQVVVLNICKKTLNRENMYFANILQSLQTKERRMCAHSVGNRNL